MIGLAEIRGRMRRRLLLTYRVDPAIAREILPAQFRPQLVDGSAVGGVCMIALADVRPGWFRPRLGVATENVAHRFAVEWDDGGEVRRGVYVTERHSSGLIPVIGGGRFFPGVQTRAQFDADETETRFRLRMTAPDATVAADVELTDDWDSSLFATEEDASAFYRAGAIGWSPGRGERGPEALELTAGRWAVRAGRVNEVSSSFFDALPSGSARLDSALVMRDIPVVWRRPDASRL
ncbi:MAG: DUF2071 domain-containing protein [Candidatus Microbacterium colombiense]|nr:MAG: DUF2071 domain-containing protein [Microbacterium sp.]